MIEASTLSDAPALRLANPSDMRRHQRVKVTLLGRYMLPDRQEYPCQTVDMSPGGVRLTCAVLGQVGVVSVNEVEIRGGVGAAIGQAA